MDVTQAVFRLNNQIAQKEEELNTLKFALAHLKDELVLEFNELNEKKALVETQQGTINALTTEKGNLENAVSEKDLIIAEKENIILTKEVEITELKKPKDVEPLAEEIK